MGAFSLGQWLGWGVFQVAVNVEFVIVTASEREVFVVNQGNWNFLPILPAQADDPGALTLAIANRVT